MKATQVHRLEWIQATYKRWELQNKSNGHETIAAINLHGEKWMPRVIAIGGAEAATGLPESFAQAKATAATAALQARGFEMEAHG